MNVTIEHLVTRRSEGILRSTMAYGLDTILESNTVMRWYRYSPHNLVEITINDDNNIRVGAYSVEEKMYAAETYRFVITAYNEKKEYMRGKRILFDIEREVMVSYDDFDPEENLDIFAAGAKNLAFIVDVGEWYQLVTDKTPVYSFSPTEISKWLDLSLLTFCNNSRFLRIPLIHEPEGVIFTCILSGILSGANKDEFRTQLAKADVNGKFVYGTRDLRFDSTEIEDCAKSLRLDLLRKNTTISKDKNDDGTILLSEIIKVGFDEFVKTIDSPTRKIAVKIDVNDCKAKEIYIWQELLYMIPDKDGTISYHQNLFRSKNICYIFSK